MPNPIRFATFNASLNRGEEGQLIADLSTQQNEQAQTVAEIIQRVNPDVLLVNEFDFDSEGEAAELFQENYLGISQNGVDPVEYPFVYIAPSNTGIYSGFDLDNNEEIVTTPDENGYGNDAFGFGNFPGQFGMVLYSKYPFVEEEVRTFQNFLWKDIPGALLPDNLDTPEPNDWYSEEELEVFRLSSKSHWDVPINVNGEIVHVLVSHPTPPVFDGEEDRNGRRNHDEIRFWADYVTPGEGDYIYDDAGNFGGLNPGNSFVIMGDQNADPVDGDSFNNAINQLLENPLVNTSVTPGSNGGVNATNRQGGESANEPEAVLQDPENGEIQNFNTNFKFIPWENVATGFEEPLEIDRFSYNPRQISDSLINGIASGDTTQTSTVLWANSNAPGEITFEVATNPEFTNIIQIVSGNLTDAPVKVEITELNPDTEYYYRVTDAAGSTEIGKFNTAAELGNQTGLKFGVTGNWRGGLSPYPAISNADEADLDFFVLNGDVVYADLPSPAVPKPQAETLAEFQAKYEEVYVDRFGENTWADLRATTSILATIDDHEITDDLSGGAPASSDPRFPETQGLINDTQLFENGLQAFQEFNPLQDEFYGNTGEDRTAGEQKLYRYNTFGSDAATFVLDVRSFRDQELGPAEVTPEGIAEFLEASFNPDRTILGEPQLEDLKNDLLQAENDGITWKFVMVPEPIQNFGPSDASDRFEGYAAERTEILKFIDDNDIDNVVFVAGDIRGTVVNNLTYQEEFGGEQIATNAFEITTGAVAFEPTFGPSTVESSAAFNLLTPEEVAFYESLPVIGDSGSEINDKDDFIKSLLNEGLATFGYDPIGLNDNLEIADGQIDATLVQGDYVATHTFGWTEFEIDPETQQLRVVTYGVEPYSEDELLANPEDIINREPVVVSEFVVNPTETIEPIIVGIDVEPETVSENAGQYTLTFNLSAAAPEGGLRVIWSETDSDDAFGDIEFPPELTNASNLEELDAVGDELARSAITIEEGATTATVTWTTIPDEESEGEETTTIELIEIEDYVVDVDNQVAQVTIVDAVDQEILGTPEDERLNGNFGDDTITGLTGNDTLIGSGGDDLIIGSRGDDFLYGQDDDDVLEGRLGNDFLFGGDGNDEMNGGQGRDRLNGGSGNDTMTGGASIDRFIFATSQEFDADDIGVDEITDFVVGQDQILLDRTTFTAINDIATDFATVTSNNAAATSDAVIVYNSNNGALFYNTNGSANGFGDGAQFATLSNGALLEVDDFVIRG